MKNLPVAAGSINSIWCFKNASSSPCTSALLLCVLQLCFHTQHLHTDTLKMHTTHRLRDNQFSFQRRSQTTWKWRCLAVTHGSATLLLGSESKAVTLLRREARPYREPFHHLRRSMCFSLAAGWLLGYLTLTLLATCCNYPSRKRLTAARSLTGGGQ